VRPPRSLADGADIVVCPCRWRSPPGAEPRPAPRRCTRSLRRTSRSGKARKVPTIRRHAMNRPIRAS
jgi:hypothetical protein